MEFIEIFPYVIQYKKDKENIVADGLSQGYVLLYTLNARLFGFEYTKEVYVNDNDFSTVYNACDKATFSKFYKLDVYPFKEITCVY